MAKSQIRAPDIALPQRMSVRFFKTDDSDIVWIVISLAVVFFVTSRYSFWVEGAFAALVCIAMMHRLADGRIYQLGYDELRNFKHERFGERQVWNSKSRKLSPISHEVDEIVDAAKGLSIGLLRVDNRGTYAIGILGSGSALTTLSLDAQYIKLNAFAREVRQLNKNVGISWFIDFNRSDPWPLADYYAEALNPPVAFPDIVNGDGTARKRFATLNQLVTEIQEIDRVMAQSVQMGMIVTVMGNRSLAKSKDSVQRSTVQTAPALRIAQRLSRRLKDMGINDIHIATGAEMRRLQRTGWDAATTQAYFDLEHGGNVIEASDDKPASYSPQKAIHTRRRALHIDDATWVGVLRVTKLPVSANPMSMLDRHVTVMDWDGNTRPVNGRFVVVGEAANLRSESFALSRAIPIMDAINDLYSGGGYRTRASRDRDAALRQREDELGDSNYRQVHFRVIYIVKGDSLEELDDNVSATQTMLESEGFECSPVKGTHQLLRALKSADGVNHM